MKNDAKKMSFQLLMLITTPKLAEKAVKIFQKGALPVQYRFSARGTASNEIMDMLGLGGIDKCVLISMVPKHLSDILIDKLNTELRLESVNSGVAFTIPLTGANHLILRMLTQNIEKPMYFMDRKEENEMAETKYVLIAAIVNRGFDGDVMEAARAVGAKGGTVVQRRRIENEEVVDFWGLSVQKEKEIVMILSETENKMKLMQSIGEKCGMNSDAKGIVMSLPIDSVVGF